MNEIEAQLADLGIANRQPAVAGAHFHEHLIDIYRCHLTDLLDPLVDADRQAIYDAIQWSNNLVHGDLILVVPKLRVEGIKPAQWAQDLSAQIPPTSLFSPPIAHGIHLRFSFAPTTLPSLIVPFILDRKQSYGHYPTLGLKEKLEPGQGRQKIIIGFSSPNIAKEFHAGHLRSTIIGAYLANLYQDMGWDVVKINYLGDWGKQFGLLAVGWEKYGSEEAFEQDALAHLLEVYVRINREFKPEEDARKAAIEAGQDASVFDTRGLYLARNTYFKRMEDGDPEAVALWRRFRDLSIQRYIEAYGRLNISFDVYDGESQVKPESIQEVEQILRQKGITEDDNGALSIDFEKHGAPKLDKVVLRNRQGTSTYLSRDVAALIERSKTYHFDKMIYVVSSQQDTYFQRLFKVVELMGKPELAAKVQHVSFGKVLGMSTRAGNVQLLSDILDGCGEAMHKVMRTNEATYAQIEDPKAVSDILGISAVMCQDMSGKRINNYPFDMNRMTSFEGDTGPYLQYTHARLCSVARKSQIDPTNLKDADFSLLTEPHVIDSLRLMAQYPDMTMMAYKTMEPTTILTYLFKLCHQISSGYDAVRVVGVKDKKLKVARAAYFEAARQVIANGLRLLGMTPVQRMWIIIRDGKFDRRTHRRLHGEPQICGEDE